jgi:hypothetical protein
MAKNYDIATIKKAIKDSKGLYTIISEKLGCSWHTAKKYVESNEETLKAYNSENESVIDFAESKLIENIEDGDVTSIIFYLKTKGKNRGYIEKTQNENTNTETKTINIVYNDKEINLSTKK